MITLTRLTGARFALNQDLVERVDCTPDTVITLVDGTKYLVAESLDEVSRRVLDFRARIVAEASAYEHAGHVPDPRTRLAAVRGPLAPVDDPAEDADPDGAQDLPVTGEPGRDGRDGRDNRDSAVIALEPRTV